MTVQAKKWQMYPAAPDAFLASSHEHPILLQVLYNRGVRTSEAATKFLDGADAVQENPYILRDMPQAVQRIVRAIEQREIICVYGDFDADGVTSTVLMVDALKAAGARVGAYIPDRVDEGYGLNVTAMEHIAGKGASLLVTVDCGIRSIEEVAAANRLGLDVIVTDHHSVGRELPPALAVVNPRRSDCPSPFERLAGVGVAYRLAQAVLRAVAQQPGNGLDSDAAAEWEEALLDLVAVGTVADLMPLIDENRSLVRRGLAQLQRAQRVGFYALMEASSLQPGSVDSSAISFRLAPRINAAGRLQHADLAYDLLHSQEYAHAYDLAMRLERLNQQRRSLTASAQVVAEEQVAAQMEDNPPIYIASSTQFQPGIVGLVAGQLTDRFYRPAVVIQEGEEESRGSARSIDEFDITDALDEVASLLVRHGGHSRAAGFTVRTEQLPALKEALQEIARDQLSQHTDLRPTLWIDCELPLDDVNWALQKQLARLEPTGEANDAPLFLCHNCRVREARAVGQGKHLKLTIDRDPGSSVLDAIAFHQGKWRDALGQGSRIDLAFHLEINEWQNRQQLQLNVQDLRISDG